MGHTIHGSVTVASQGQIVIPAKLRRKLNIKPGDSLIVFTKHSRIIGLIREQDASEMIKMYEAHVRAGQQNLTKLKKIAKKK
ncbi:AbrB/MazE/SpoVT family DNA-binding domain-containing protein [Patescibacteria group bacterium]|nr:AbrB/MazE/SpoVT family DNA-binding domain-containing protein [Patescibacteria group bacterium]